MLDSVCGHKTLCKTLTCTKGKTLICPILAVSRELAGAPHFFPFSVGEEKGRHAPTTLPAGLPAGVCHRYQALLQATFPAQVAARQKELQIAEARRLLSQLTEAPPPATAAASPEGEGVEPSASSHVFGGALVEHVWHNNHHMWQSFDRAAPAHNSTSTSTRFGLNRSSAPPLTPIPHAHMPRGRPSTDEAGGSRGQQEQAVAAGQSSRVQQQQQAGAAGHSSSGRGQHEQEVLSPAPPELHVEVETAGIPADLLLPDAPPSEPSILPASWQDDETLFATEPQVCGGGLHRRGLVCLFLCLYL